MYKTKIIWYNDKRIEKNRRNEVKRYLKERLNIKNTVVLGLVGSIISILVMTNIIIKKQCDFYIGIGYLINDIAFGIYFYTVQKRIKGKNLNISIAQKLLVNTTILQILIYAICNNYLVWKLALVNRIDIPGIVLLLEYFIMACVMDSEYIILFLYFRYLFFKKGIRINTNILYVVLISKIILVFLLSIQNGEYVLRELLIVESEFYFIYPYLYVYTKLMKGEY